MGFWYLNSVTHDSPYLGITSPMMDVQYTTREKAGRYVVDQGWSLQEQRGRSYLKYLSYKALNQLKKFNSEQT